MKEYKGYVPLSERRQTQWTESQKRAWAQWTNCPKRCGLKLARTPCDDYSCSRCKKAFPHGTWLLGCRTCNYDMCKACALPVGGGGLQGFGGGGLE